MPRIHAYGRRFTVAPESALGKLATIAVMFLLLVVVVILFTVGAAVVGLGLLLAPAVAWWQRRRLGKREPTTRIDEFPEAEPPRMIDAEFTPPRE